MYCSECGSKLDENARFCGVCGTRVEIEIAESGSVFSAKKKKKVVVIAVSVAAAFLIRGVLLVSLIVFGGMDKIRVARLCSLGDRYLSELEYEKAIAAYEAAIEIEPREEAAYIGLADAYIGLGDYEAAVEALEAGIEETDSEKLMDYRDDVQKEWDDRERRNEFDVPKESDVEVKDTKIQSEEYVEKSKENLQYDTEHYERRYGDDVYEDLMVQLDICLYLYQFANVDDIQDVGIYFSFFYAYEHHWDYTGEQYYDPVDGYYKIPGDEIRRVLMKYMDFQELDLSEVLPGKSNTMSNWYDAENDIYYTPILGSFGGYHPGFSSITYETLAPGVIKAVGDGTTTIVVREEDDGILRLISYVGS